MKTKLLWLAVVLACVSCAKPEVDTGADPEPKMIFKEASPAPTPEVQQESFWTPEPSPTPAPVKKRTFKRPSGS